jgi:hypothetical protein
MQPNTAPNETKLPRAVLRRSAAIQARIDARNAPNEPETTPTSDAAPATEPAAAPAPATEPQAAAPAADPRDSDPSYWKQRFSVTEGILRRERSDRATERDSLYQRIAKLEDESRTLQATAKPADDAIDLTQFYTPAQIEQYGEEQCRVMAATAMRAARTTAQQAIDAAVRPVREQQERQQTDTAEAARTGFEDALTEQLPNWREVDADQRWRAWLAEEDENEVVRQTILNVYISKGNAVGATRMMKKWLATTRAAAPAAAPVPQPPMTPSGSGANPEGGNAPAPSPAAMQGAPTDVEVRDFYKRSSLGKVKETERVAFEARLALRNGAR